MPPPVVLGHVPQSSIDTALCSHGVGSRREEFGDAPASPVAMYTIPTADHSDITTERIYNVAKLQNQVGITNFAVCGVTTQSGA